MTELSSGIFKQLRDEYHKNLCINVLGSRGEDKGLNIADTRSKSSRALARLIVEKMGYDLCEKPPVGQTAGTLFGQYTAEYIQKAFSLINHLRPGKWVYTATGATGIA